MKKIKLLLLMSTIFAVITANGQWINVTSGTTINLKEIVFADSISSFEKLAII